MIKSRILIFALALPAGMGLASCGPIQNREQDERYIVESEKQWAESTASGDASAVERILADDYLGIAPDGTFSDKKAEVAGTHTEHNKYVSNHVNDVKVRFYGETAIAQGSETWERQTGEPRRGRYVWTDTWLRRNGRWQIVAAEDLIAPEYAATRP
jgi:ketosteroid isomerase-like protein